ncbi:MAG TPA: aspartate--tRNA(Asn) ligase [Clostridiales bacterium]|nr:aspartate--tRNA(Asn) ligase [Clostridiales bacterium]
MIYINGNIENNRVEAEHFIDFIGKEVSLQGVIYKIREMSGFAFVLLQTKRHMVQCVWSEEFSLFPLSDLVCNMSVLLTAVVISEERSSTGCELRMKSIKKLSAPVEQTPIVINNRQVGVSLDILLQYRPITLRNERERAIFKIQEGLCSGFRKFFGENNFTEIHTPKIVYSGAEGGANIFKLDYFGKEAYLAQSPQFYKQMMVGVFERVFEIAPVFRAEKHHTARHINEYTSVDFEVGFIENYTEIMTYETKMLIETLDFLQAHYAYELNLLKVKIPTVNQIPAVDFEDAKCMLEKTYKRVSTDMEDFEPEEEKLLCDLIKKETGSEFVFVTRYKSSKRPFYAMETPGNSNVTESFDLLFRGLEITTGGQRIHDYDEQVEKMKNRGMNVDLFKSYLMAHQYGLPPHGGLGLGLERFTARLLDLPNVRQATLFPRDTERLEP